MHVVQIIIHKHTDSPPFIHKCVICACARICHFGNVRAPPRVRLSLSPFHSHDLCSHFSERPSHIVHGQTNCVPRMLVLMAFGFFGLVAAAVFAKCAGRRLRAGSGPTQRAREPEFLSPPRVLKMCVRLGCCCCCCLCCIWQSTPLENALNHVRLCVNT